MIVRRCVRAACIDERPAPRAPRGCAAALSQVAARGRASCAAARCGCVSRLVRHRVRLPTDYLYGCVVLHPLLCDKRPKDKGQGQRGQRPKKKNTTPHHAPQSAKRGKERKGGRTNDSLKNSQRRRTTLRPSPPLIITPPSTRRRSGRRGSRATAAAARA